MQFWEYVMAYTGMIFIFASFLMNGMVPLRVLAIASNLCLMAYGASLIKYEGINSAWASLILQCALLPLNLKRLWDIKRLTAEIKSAKEYSPVSQSLLPYMTRCSFKPGEVLFRKGDEAHEIFYIASGQVMVEGRSELLGAGDFIGEIGLFSPERRRTKTVTCQTEVTIYRMTDEMIFQLYYQHPQIGFYFIRLVAQRLLRDVALDAHKQ
jgi:CRP/FNR family transcriptional regulator, cyclic AMP receptor protein